VADTKKLNLINNVARDIYLAHL